MDSHQFSTIVGDPRAFEFAADIIDIKFAKVILVIEVCGIPSSLSFTVERAVSVDSDSIITFSAHRGIKKYIFTVEGTHVARDIKAFRPPCVEPGQSLQFVDESQELHVFVREQVGHRVFAWYFKSTAFFHREEVFCCLASSTARAEFVLHVNFLAAQVERNMTTQQRDKHMHVLDLDFRGMHLDYYVFVGSNILSILHFPAMNPVSDDIEWIHILTCGTDWFDQHHGSHGPLLLASHAHPLTNVLAAVRVHNIVNILEPALFCLPKPVQFWLEFELFVNQDWNLLCVLFLKVCVKLFEHAGSALGDLLHDACHKLGAQSFMVYSKIERHPSEDDDFFASGRQKAQQSVLNRVDWIAVEQVEAKPLHVVTAVDPLPFAVLWIPQIEVISEVSARTYLLSLAVVKVEVKLPEFRIQAGYSVLYS